MASVTQTSLMERYKRVMFPAVTNYYGEKPLIVDHAKDQFLWDTDGKRYLDLFGGVLTVSVGHCNEYVTQRTIEQLQRLQHTTTLYVNEVMVEVAEKVEQLTPGRLQQSLFTNSGTEANERALLAARMYTGNQTIIALRHAYSGGSMLTMSVTAHGTWRLGGAFDGNIKHIRNPYMYRAPKGLSPEEFLDMCVQDLEETLATLTNGRVAAFIAEPIQGVGGFIVPPADYFKRIVPIIRAAGGVFIADEVQTGWGRTGDKWFGIEHWGVEPDLMTFAKGMANGSPIGCTVATPEVAEAVKGTTFATFGGNPVTMATALATIEYMEEHDIKTNAQVQGTALRTKLDEFGAEFPFIGDVRGMGLMQGLEIVKPGTQEPDAPKTLALINAAREQGLLIGRGGLYGNVVRISPHLNASAADIEMGMDMLGKALLSVAQ